MLKIAICYEPPLAGSTADMADIEAEAAFLEKYIPHKVRRLPYEGNPCTYLAELGTVDVAWNLFESFDGREDLQHMGAALLELAKRPYTGTRLPGLVNAIDKRQIKALLQDAAVNVAESYKAGKFTKGKWIVKPAKLHGSVGIDDDSIIDATEEAELISAIAAKPELELFAERYLEGAEYSATLLDKGQGLDVIAVARMQFLDFPAETPQILSFDAKWQEDSAVYRQTVRSFQVDRQIGDQIAAAAKRAALSVGLAGYARIDFRINKDGEACVIDVNPNPGLSVDSGFIAACREAGIDTSEALEYIIKAAIS